jgi:hypothetical protein
MNSAWRTPRLRWLAVVALGAATLARVSAGPGAERDQAIVAQSPTLPPRFSTYLSGARGAEIRGMATDLAGNVYLTGGTDSPDFPATPGAFQTTHNGGQPARGGITPTDVFVTKLDPRGAIVWSTFIGGPNHDRAYAIEVDRRGYVYVAGRAGAGFPVTPGAFQTSFMGGQEASFYGPQDGFVCKITPDGSALVFCSYFGTADPRIVRDLAVDSRGDVYIASGSSGGIYPPAVQQAFTNTPLGGDDAVVAKISSDGSRVLWAAYVGGSRWEGHQNSIRLDGAGDPYLLTTTMSADAATTAGVFQPAHAGSSDLYVAKLSAEAGTVVWATYLGGRGRESTETHELAVDAAGSAYVVVPTTSSDFPTTPGTLQTTYRGGASDVAIAKLSPDGARLLAGSFLGGAGADRSEGVAVDGSGNVHFTGRTTSPDFPVTENAFQRRRGTGWDAIVVVVSADLRRLVYSSYLGGSGDDFGRAATMDSNRNLYIGGGTTSRDWPVLGARPTASRGPRDAIVAAFRFGPERGGALP